MSDITELRKALEEKRQTLKVVQDPNVEQALILEIEALKRRIMSVIEGEKAKKAG